MSFPSFRSILPRHFRHSALSSNLAQPELLVYIYRSTPVWYIYHEYIVCASDLHFVHEWNKTLNCSMTLSWSCSPLRMPQRTLGYLQQPPAAQYQQNEGDAPRCQTLLVISYTTSHSGHRTSGRNNDFRNNFHFTAQNSGMLILVLVLKDSLRIF